MSGVENLIFPLKNVTQAEFHNAMQALPLVSVNWVVVDVDGRVLTGWRENAPARHCWFTPGDGFARASLGMPMFSRICAGWRKN